MKRFVFLAAMAVVCVLWPASAAQAKSGVGAFEGRWDLTIQAPEKEYPSWIEIGMKDGQPTARFVGRWGHARALPTVTIEGKKIHFVSPKEEEGSKNDLVFDGTLNGERLAGTAVGPDGAAWKWSGVRAPALERSKAPEWGETITLFDGRDLSAWKPSRAGGPSWTVVDGAMVKPPQSPEMTTERKFTDFKLHIEFNCGKEANSGVYLRGRYEVQIETQSEEAPPNRHMAGVYGYLAPKPMLPRNADTWQTYEITFVGRKITLVQNGQTVLDDEEIPGITGGALDSHEGEPGPIYLQGSEDGTVKFRNITITPAK